MTERRANGRRLIVTALALAVLLALADRVPAFAAARRQMWSLHSLAYQEMLEKLAARPNQDVGALVRGASVGLAAPQPSADPAPGSFVGATEITLTMPPGVTGDIHYSLDGSVPTRMSPRYREPIRLDTTSVLRWRVLRRNALPGRVATGLYLIDGDDLHLPHVGLTMDSLDLWGKYSGIYVRPLERGREFERHAHVSVVHADGVHLGFDAQVRIHGGYSRLSEKKSFRLRYDVREVPVTHPFAWLLRRDRDSGERHLVLRTTGTASLGRVADALSTTLYGRMGYPVSRGISVWLLINGADWGVYELREYVGEGFLRAKVGQGAYEILAHDSERPALWVSPVLGTGRGWEQMLSYLGANDLARPTHFDSASKLLDPMDLADYWAHNVYTGNLDWPYNNTIAYRDVSRGGAFRFLLWDADAAFASLGDFVEHNTLAWALRSRPADSLKWNAGSGGINDSERLVSATAPIRSFLKNTQFREAFITRLLVRLSTQYRPEVVRPLLDSIVDEAAPVINRDLARWGATGDRYRAGIARMQDFVNRRPEIVRSHLAQHFSLGADRPVTIDVRGPGSVEIGGTVLRDTTITLLMLERLRVEIVSRPDSAPAQGAEVVSVAPGRTPRTMQFHFAP